MSRKRAKRRTKPKKAKQKKQLLSCRQLAREQLVAAGWVEASPGMFLRNVEGRVVNRTTIATAAEYVARLGVDRLRQKLASMNEG